MSEPVYLDYNATAPLRPEALTAMLPVLRTVGNASSPHLPGKRSAEQVAAARKEVAALIRCSSSELIFTSGATEANNLVLRSSLKYAKHLITTSVEHPAILETARELSREYGVQLTVLPVDGNGRLDYAALKVALKIEGTAVVSVMAANNETGVLFDLGKIAAEARKHDAVIHTDATQMVGRLPVDLSTLDVDYLTLSAHKFGGPQGVGALFARSGSDRALLPAQYGGGQEKGIRAGTLNVAGIVGAGAAAAAANETMSAEVSRVLRLRNELESELVRRIPMVRINCSAVPRLPNVSSITLFGAPADALIAQMPDVAASDGSACSSGVPGPSHVLQALGMPQDEAECTLRFSLGYGTTSDDIKRAIGAVERAVHLVRSFVGYSIADESASQHSIRVRHRSIGTSRNYV